VIGYYIHHLGRGHLRQAQCIAAHLTDEVTGLSSVPEPADWPGKWVTLPRDDTASAAREPTAGGHLHWAPLGDAGLRDRMAAIAGWIQMARPSVIVVDVSVEVSTLARLMGVPVVIPALPGSRSDPAHRLGYGIAEQVIAPWPAFISPALIGRSAEAMDRIEHVGAFSRFDGRPAAPRRHPRRPAVLVFMGQGGTGVTNSDVHQAAARTPGWTWTALGGSAHCWEEDPWPALCQADVVVTHAGLSALAEVAAARKPAIVIPQHRPHKEQATTARALAAAGLAVTADSWPASQCWNALLSTALDLGGDQWSAWSPGTGARQAAELIQTHRKPAFPCAVP
jgi:predicted glycosyltransferase